MTLQQINQQFSLPESGPPQRKEGRRRLLKLVAALGSIVALSGAGMQSRPAQAADQPASHQTGSQRPNIVWIMFDDGRADAVGAYGQPWAHTPNIDTIAAGGVRFVNSIVQNPVCAPQRSSLKTGFYAHEVAKNELGAEPAKLGNYVNKAEIERHQATPTLLDEWAEAGIQPTNIGKIHSFQRSWTQLGDFKPIPPWSRDQANEEEAKKLIPGLKAYTRLHGWLIGSILEAAPEETDTGKIGAKAVETINDFADKGKPFFLRLSFHSPHVPDSVPKQFFVDPATIKLPLPAAAELADRPVFERGAIRAYSSADLTPEQIGLARGTYYGMVSEVDAQVGKVVETLRKRGLLDNTIIAVNSDSGFQLGEHGVWKKRVFYEQNVKVPFILSWPKGLPKGKVIDEPVEQIDFLPTLLDLSSLPVPKEIHGRSLRPLINGKVQRWRKATISEIDHSESPYIELRGGGRQVMVRTNDWKLITFFDERIVDKDGALFDLKNDPGETRNLYNDPAHAGKVKELEGLLQEWDRTKNLLIDKKQL